MALCTVCGEKYYSKECPSCVPQNENRTKSILSKPKTQDQERKYKTYEETHKFKIPNIQKPNIKFKEIEINSKNIFLSLLSVFLLVLIVTQVYDRYQLYKAEKMMLEMLYGTSDTDKIKKQNKELSKKTKESLNQLYEVNKKSMETLQKLQEKLYK